MHFFASDAYHAWNLWCQRESATLRNSIKIIFDPRLREDEDETEAGGEGEDDEDGLPPSNQLVTVKKKRKTKYGPNGEGGVQGLDITNDSLGRHLQKSRDILHPDSDLACDVCHDLLKGDHSFTLVCPHAFCEHVAHVTCLARIFLQQESSNSKATMAVLPTHGECPRCKNMTTWVDLVKELSVRTRSKPKKPAGKRGKAKKGVEEEEEEEESEDDEAGITAADLAEMSEGREGEQAWDYNTDIDSTLSDTGSEKSKTRKGKGKARRKKTPPIVIEDSDMDTALSASESETGSTERKKPRKGKGKARGKKSLLDVMEDSDMDSSLSDVGSVAESVKGASKPKKGSAKTRGKKALPVVIEDSNGDSDLSDR